MSGRCTFATAARTTRPSSSRSKRSICRSSAGHPASFCCITTWAAVSGPMTISRCKPLLGPGNSKRISAPADVRPLRPAVFQPGLAGAGADRGGRLAGTVGGDVRARRRARPAAWAGQELTHFKLAPGEQVRTPLIVLQFHDGNRLAARTCGRRRMLAHTTRVRAGNCPRAPGGLQLHQYARLINPDTASQSCHRSLPHRVVKLDYCGWTGLVREQERVAQHRHLEVDQKRFPSACGRSRSRHAKGVRTILCSSPSGSRPARGCTRRIRVVLAGGRRTEAAEPGQPSGPAVADRPRGQAAHEQGIAL